MLLFRDGRVTQALQTYSARCKASFSPSGFEQMVHRLGGESLPNMKVVVTLTNDTHGLVSHDYVRTPPTVDEERWVLKAGGWKDDSC